MKLFLGLISMLLLLSCGGGDKQSEVGKLLEGEHELRKFNVVDEEGYRTRGSYFLFSGGSYGETYKDTKVSFSFQLPDSTYAMGELYFEDIRVKIDSNIERPYVTFNWSAGSHDFDMNYVMMHNVNYMVVHCKEEDFPYEVNIKEL